jgi:hypothetical protein
MSVTDNAIEKINSVLENQYVSGALTVFLIVYASMAAPKLPNYLTKLFDYTLTKLVVFFLIVYLMKRNATVALVAAVALMVTIMALERVKFGKEMMEVVGKSDKKIKLGDCSCDCTCGSIENIVPQTEEGHLVIKEVKQAVTNGDLHPAVAHAMAQSVVKKEIDNIPILESTTKHGAVKMEEIAKAEETGLLNSDDAKKLAAKVVVNELVAQSNGLILDEIGEPIKNYENYENYENYDHREMMTSIGSEYNPDDVMLPTVTVGSEQVQSTMTDLAEEVLRRKNEETARRGGVQPSPEEIKQLCASVLEEYKGSPTCGSDCVRQNGNVDYDLPRMTISTRLADPRSNRLDRLDQLDLLDRYDKTNQLDQMHNNEDVLPNDDMLDYSPLF